MNVVCIAGNLTKNPEIRSTQNDKKVATFTIAINEGKDKTEFVNCVAWEKTAELIEKYCGKGDRISLSGRIQTDKQEKDGETKYYTKIVVNQFDFPPKQKEQSKTDEVYAPRDEDDFSDSIPF